MSAVSSILVLPARRELCQGTKLKSTTPPPSPYFAQPRLEEKSVLQITTAMPSSPLDDGCDISFVLITCVCVLMSLPALYIRCFLTKVSCCKVIPCPILLIRAELSDLDPSAELCLRAKAHLAATTLLTDYPSAKAADEPKCNISTHNGHRIWLARLMTCH